MKAIITVGVSASGKTIWAKEYAKKHKAVISNRDDLRFSLTGANNWGEYKFDKKIESFISELQWHTATKAAALGKDFILADTNLDSSRRLRAEEQLKDLGYDVEIKPFHVTLDEAWKRDSLRSNGVGRDVIYKQWEQWLEYLGNRKYSPNSNLPKAIIFDIDGTLAHMNNRKPFDWYKVGNDSPDPIVFSMARTFHMDGYRIIFVSGRDGSCREQTTQWLDAHLDWVFSDNDLLMRPEKDFRKDTDIKQELFWSHIAEHYNVEAVVDDRPCVVRMWYDLGIPKVIAVGNPYKEF